MITISLSYKGYTIYPAVRSGTAWTDVRSEAATWFSRDCVSDTDAASFSRLASKVFSTSGRRVSKGVKDIRYVAVS